MAATAQATDETIKTFIEYKHPAYKVKTGWESDFLNDSTTIPHPCSYTLYIPHTTTRHYSKHSSQAKKLQSLDINALMNMPIEGFEKSIAELFLELISDSAISVLTKTTEEFIDDKSFIDFLNQELTLNLDSFEKSHKEKELHEYFSNELEKYSFYLSDRKRAEEIFSRVSSQIARINYKKIALEITPSDAVKFTVILSDNLTAYITQPFTDASNLKNGEAIFSLFDNDERIISDVTQLSNLVKAINQHLLL